MKNDTADLLFQLYENLGFGKHMLKALILRTRDGTFRNALAEQYAHYHTLMEKACVQLGAQLGNEGRGGRKRFFDACARASLRMHLKIDSTSSHMAEMVLQGCTMNLIDAARGLRVFAGANDAAKALAQKLISMEQKNIDRMTEYL